MNTCALTQLFGLAWSILILTTTTIIDSAQANHNERHQDVIINQGSSPCYELHSKELSEVSVKICFAVSKDTLTATYSLLEMKKGAQPTNYEFQLEAAHLWMGDNIDDLPMVRARNAGGDSAGIDIRGGEPVVHVYPYHTKRKQLQQMLPSSGNCSTITVLEVSLSLTKDLDFGCPDSGSLFLASLHATVTATHATTKETTTIDLAFVNQKETGSFLDQIVPLTLVCALYKDGDAATETSYLRRPMRNMTATGTDTAILRQRQRRDQNNDTDNCPALYPDEDDIVLSLSETFLKTKVKLMVDFTTLVDRGISGPIEDLIDDQRLIYERFDGWSDINDQALVAKTKDTQTCFSAFQPTQGLNPLDQWQNINPFRTRIRDSDCISRRGYHAAYFATYYDEYRKSVDDCVASCELGCPLVVGGHSQGGSVSIVGSIDLARYNPEVITFGAPRTIINTEACTAANATQHYRFQNTLAKRYDFAPFQINVFNEKHIGFSILLDNVGNFPLSQPKFEDNKTRLRCDIGLHDPELYIERIDEIVSRKCFPVPVSKWPKGHYCSYDDECQSLNCNSHECREGLRA